MVFFSLISRLPVAPPSTCSSSFSQRDFSAEEEAQEREIQRRLQEALANREIRPPTVATTPTTTTSTTTTTTAPTTIRREDEEEEEEEEKEESDGGNRRSRKGSRRNPPEPWYTKTVPVLFVLFLFFTVLCCAIGVTATIKECMRCINCQAGVDAIVKKAARIRSVLCPDGRERLMDPIDPDEEMAIIRSGPYAQAAFGTSTPRPGSPMPTAPSIVPTPTIPNIVVGSVDETGEAGEKAKSK